MSLSIARGLFGVPRIIASGLAAAVTGVAVDTSIKAITIPANTLTAGDQIRIWALWDITNSANAKTAIIDFNGFEIMATGVEVEAQLQRVAMITIESTTQSWAFLPTSPTGVGENTSPSLNVTIDTTTDMVLDFIAGLTDVGDSMGLHGYIVEHIKSR